MSFGNPNDASIPSDTADDDRDTLSDMAGDNTGSLAIVIENESLAALAANQGKTQASAEWQKVISDVQQAGIGRVVSNSLWIDVTPQ